MINQPIRMAKIKTNLTVYQPLIECRGSGILIYCWWKCKIVQICWKTVLCFLKNLNVNLHIIQPFYCGYLLRLNVGICLYKDFYLNVQSSFICNSPKLEIALCSLAGEWINMDGTRDSHTKRSKLERERQMIPHIWNLLYGTNEPFHRKERRTWRTDLWLPRGKRREWDGLRVWG